MLQFESIWPVIVAISIREVKSSIRSSSIGDRTLPRGQDRWPVSQQALTLWAAQPVATCHFDGPQ